MGYTLECRVCGGEMIRCQDCDCLFCPDCTDNNILCEECIAEEELLDDEFGETEGYLRDAWE